MRTVLFLPVIIFADNRAGGACTNASGRCSEEKNAICIDGICVCRVNFTLIGGSCVPGKYRQITTT